VFDKSRREFLEFMGRGTMGAAVLSSPLLQGCVSLMGSEHSVDLRTYPSDRDELILAPGLRYEIIAKWQDPIDAKGELHFGFNNDFLAFFPLEGKVNEGLLCVNHEYPDPLFVCGYVRGSGPKTKEQVDKERDCVGVSILHIVETEPGSWRIVRDSEYNRRITGATPIPFAGGLKILGSGEAIGTFGNCAGGVTPWGTYLTCEEVYEPYYGEVDLQHGRRVSRKNAVYGWWQHYDQPPEHYGWVVEIDPFTGRAKKHVSMGRVWHECATTTVASDGRTVVYTGDDFEGEHLYKFISEKPGALERGTLYVADIENGRWISLSRRDNEVLRREFRDQLSLLIQTRKAAKLVGATPLDRPEDIEICPRTRAVYVSLTNGPSRGNLFGSILKIVEKDNDPLSLEFEASTFLPGGIQTGFACPDNLAFDKKGNLWVTTDISGSNLNKGEYSPFKNNGLFYVPMSGPDAGIPKLVATAPVEAELTGPTFSPDGRTLFLSVQHPGEKTKSLDALTSHWPGGGDSIPRPAVVAISGPALDRVMQ